MRRIPSLLVTGTFVAITSDAEGALLVTAPFGSYDTFNGILRTNKPHGKHNLFTAKAASYSASWPWRHTIDWDD